MCFFEFWIEGTEGQVIGVEVGFRWLKIHIVLGYYSGHVFGAMELKSLLGHAFQLFLQLDKACFRC
jgi:hypothetical protein